MEKNTKKAITVNEAFNKIVHIKIYNSFIKNIMAERPDLMDMVLNEAINNSIAIHLYRNFNSDKKEIELINDFYERLQSFYN